MVKPNADPSLNELLNRIVRLENRTARLQADVSPMKAQIVDLCEGFKFQVGANAKEILKVYDDFLWPLVHKVFPGFTQTKKQINAILNRNASSDPNKSAD
jgi:hypothetical protein